MKVYDPNEEQEPKFPQLSLKQWGDCAWLICVDEHGNPIANLIHFGDHGVLPCYSAEQCIADAGYDTSFANWDDEGRIMFDHDQNENVSIEPISFVDLFPVSYKDTIRDSQ